MTDRECTCCLFSPEVLQNHPSQITQFDVLIEVLHRKMINLFLGFEGETVNTAKLKHNYSVEAAPFTQTDKLNQSRYILTACGGCSVMYGSWKY